METEHFWRRRDVEVGRRKEFRAIFPKILKFERLSMLLHRGSRRVEKRGEGGERGRKKKRKERYSLPDSFAVPAPFVRILLADRVGQGAVEGARPDHAGQEIAELHVQLGWQGPAGCSGSCVRLDPARRRFPRSSCIRDTPLARRRRRLQLRAAAHLPHLKRDRRYVFILSTNPSPRFVRVPSLSYILSSVSMLPSTISRIKRGKNCKH